MGSLSGLSNTEADGLAVSKTIPAFMSIKGLINDKPNGSNPVPPGYTTGTPDNIEGYAFGPDLPDGRRLLLVTNDNDYLNPATLSGGYPNYIMAFAVDRGICPATWPSSSTREFPSCPSRAPRCFWAREAWRWRPGAQDPAAGRSDAPDEPGKAAQTAERAV